MSDGIARFEGGFRQPVLDAQSAFRRIMNGFAAPGSLIDLVGYADAPGLQPAVAAFLATLADHDTPVWGCGPQAAQWLAFQTGAPMADAPSQACFALVDGAAGTRLWQRFQIGTAHYPDRAATVLVTVDAIGTGEPLRLTGPGIETQRDIAVSGLPQGFADAMAGNRALFPLGLDIVLVAGAAALALPRSVTIERQG